MTKHHRILIQHYKKHDDPLSDKALMSLNDSKPKVYT